MNPETLSQNAADLATAAQDLAARAATLADETTRLALSAEPAGVPFFVVGLTVFVLAVFVGYYVVWRVTPALHSPLMSVTNAISSVIIVGALIATSPDAFNFSTFLGFLAVILASVNIFGGFIVTQRMLGMYKKKQQAKK